MSPRLCQGCRRLDGEHDFGPTCSFREEEAPAPKKPGEFLDLELKLWKELESFIEAHFVPRGGPKVQKAGDPASIHAVVLDLLNQLRVISEGKEAESKVYEFPCESCRAFAENDGSLPTDEEPFHPDCSIHQNWLNHAPPADEEVRVMVEHHQLQSLGKPALRELDKEILELQKKLAFAQTWFSQQRSPAHEKNKWELFEGAWMRAKEAGR